MCDISIMIIMIMDNNEQTGISTDPDLSIKADQDGMSDKERSIENEKMEKQPLPKFVFKKNNRPSLKKKHYNIKHHTIGFHI